MESVSSRCCVAGEGKESRKQTTIPGGPRAQQVRARLGPGSRCSLRRRWLRLEEPGQGRGEGRGWYWKGGRQGRGRKMATSGANGPGSATASASASNPRKFSEKIALQKQRQAEETAAFEEVMMDIGSTRVRGRAGEPSRAEQLQSGDRRGGAGAGVAAKEAERGRGHGRRRLGGAG